MTASNDNTGIARHDGTERRTSQHLREVFEQAYRVAYPFLDTTESTNRNGSAHFLRVILHDAFPNLHLQDVAILSVSIERVFRERGKTETL